MMQQNKVNITIKINGINPFSMTVDRSREEIDRTAQDIVNHILDAWKIKFPNLSELDLMGRVAFQLARNFETLNRNEESLRDLLESSEKDLDKLLLELN